MPLPKSCTTALLIVLPPGEPPELHRLFALLRSRGEAAASWILASGDLDKLRPEERSELEVRLSSGEDDLILQGYAGAPLPLLGDEELNVDLEEAERHARRLLDLPDGRVRQILAPVEVTPERITSLRDYRELLILGLGPGEGQDSPDGGELRRGREQLWLAGEGGVAGIPVLRLSALSDTGGVKRYRLLRRLDRDDHSALILNAADQKDLDALETILPILTTSPLSLPSRPPRLRAPERLDPLVRRSRSPLWHARLLSLSARRRHSTRGRVSPRILQPFLLPPAQLVRSSAGTAPLFENRVVHASMLGSARMEEGDLTVQFVDGMVRRLRRGEPLSTSPEEAPDATRRQASRRRAGSPTQSLGAFSFDWDTIRGLTTRTLVSAGGDEPKGRRRRSRTDPPEAPQMLVDADYLFLDELPWLVVRAMTHYPRRSPQAQETPELPGDGAPARVRPLPITLGAIGPKETESVTIRGWRHDGGSWERSYIPGRDEPVVPLPGQRLELSLGDSMVQILFLDEGHGLTWEAALECIPAGDGWEIALLPFGEFELRDEGVSTASILLALTLGERSDSPESIRKRVLRVLPSPATETGTVENHARIAGA